MLKDRILARYKHIETFLKRHPFWPSFLTDGGVLTIMLLCSLAFTIICGIQSVKDITPELKVVDIDFKGTNALAGCKVNIYRNICDNERAGDISESDQVIVEYNLSELGSSEKYINRFAKDSLVAGEFSVRFNGEIKSASSSPNRFFKTHNGVDEFETLVDTISKESYRNFFISTPSALGKARFSETFRGNFLSSSKNNPFIYFNLVIDGPIEMPSDSSYVGFTFAERLKGSNVAASPVNIINVFPEPTYVSPSYIIYSGEQFRELWKNSGFTFLAEDLGVKRKSDRATFLWTVLFGTAIALTIDILVNLILKWKMLISRNKEAEENNN